MPRLINFADPRGGRFWTPGNSGGGGGAVEYGVTGIESASPQYQDTPGYTYGWKFQVGASAVDIEGLRIYSAVSGNVNLKLWRVSDQAEIGAVTVAGVTDTWVEGSITPVTLSASAQYIVSREGASGQYHEDESDAAVSTNSALTLITGCYLNFAGYPANDFNNLRFYGVADIIITA